MRKKILGTLILLGTLISCKTASENILFSSSRNGNSDIYMMNSKGDVIKQITKEKTEEWSPVWINENEISYLSQEGEEISILRHNIQTNEKSKIKHPENCILDDKNIIYSQNSNKRIYSCKGEIYLTGGETNSTVNLTAQISGQANYISWGKNANEITFTSNHEGNNEIYLLNLELKKLENLTNNSSNDERGDLSPDGNFIVFSSDRFQKGNQDIVILNLQTREVKRVTLTKGTELIARWSSNQKSIYFGSNEDGNWELYSYELKNERIKRLTNNESFDGDPRIK